MSNRIKPIIIKEFRQIKRDKRTLGILLLIPAFMLIMFGYALNFDVKHIPLAVYDGDKTKTSREFVNNFLHSEYFELKYYLNTANEADTLLGEEKVKVAIIIPQNFANQLLTGKETSIQVIADGVNSNNATTAVGYINAITQEYSIKVLVNALARTGRSGALLPIDYRPRIWYNPELKSVKFMIPGLISFILMIVSVISTALSIVKEKERGTMEQITVSPIKPIELIIGKTIPYVIISIIAGIIILIFGYILFDVVIKGNLLLLFLITLIFLTGCLGWGLFISTISDTQQAAFMIAALTTMLPAFILSGFVFPIRNMPVIIQAITYIIPVRYFMVVLRSIILKGVGLEAFWNQVIFLIIFAVLMIGISSAKMKKSM